MVGAPCQLILWIYSFLMLMHFFTLVGMHDLGYYLNPLRNLLSEPIINILTLSFQFHVGAIQLSLVVVGL